MTRGHNVKGFVVHASAGNCDGTFIAAAAAAAGTGLIRGHFAVRWGEAGGRGSGGRLGRWALCTGEQEQFLLKAVPPRGHPKRQETIENLGNTSISCF